jgi:hypothetical protein
MASSQPHWKKDVWAKINEIPVHKPIKTKTVTPILSQRILRVAVSFNCEAPLDSAFNMMKSLTYDKILKLL